MSAVYFDLDGTLTDPKPGITGCIQYALQRMDLPVPSQDELTWCIGPPLRSSFVTMLGGEERADLAVTLYRERFSEVGLYENSLYPGIKDVLTTLGRSGRRMFVATSKLRTFAVRIIEHFGLTGDFEYVFGAELDGSRVHKTDLLAHALEATGVSASQALTIGDRSYDMIGARNNGMGAIGVLYGYGSREELIGAGASHVCATPAEVLRHIQGPDSD